MIAKNFGEIPAAGDLTGDDQALLDPSPRPSAPWSATSSNGTARRQPSGRRCARSPRSTSTSPTAEPWKLKGDDQRERLGTILHVVAQCVADLNTILSPFLPFSANAVDAVLGGRGRGAADADAGGGGRPRRRSGLPDPDRRLHRPIARWERTGRSSRGRRSPSRCRSSPSSTRRWWTRSWPGSPPDPPTGASGWSRSAEGGSSPTKTPRSASYGQPDPPVSGGGTTRIPLSASWGRRR